MRNYLCISLDGLQSGMIGAFGNTWIQTPTLDALACQAALIDRYYAASLDLTDTLTDLWQFPSGYHTVLLTDDSDVFLHEQAVHFDEKHLLEMIRRKKPAARITETQCYRNMAAVTDQLSCRNEKPFLLWAHFNVFRDRWDFPLSYRERYQIDEDPDPYLDVVLPNMTEQHISPDVRQSVQEAYSGGVTVLDEALSGLLEFLETEGLDRNTVLLLMATRGFSLGEHNYIGCCEDLYGENVHLPLMIRFPDGSYAGFRSQTLVQSADVFGLLQNAVLPEEPDAIHSSLHIENNETGDNVIITPEWYVYHKQTGDELYVKPDDRWEVNDVADRCPHILEQFER